MGGEKKNDQPAEIVTAVEVVLAEVRKSRKSVVRSFWADIVVRKGPSLPKELPKVLHKVKRFKIGY